MSNWPEIVTAVAGSGLTSGGIVAAAIKLGKGGVQLLARDIAEEANKPIVDKLADVEHDISNVKLALATQFGGNGGGMREAINSLQIDVAHIKGSLSVSTVPTMVAASTSNPAPPTV